MNMAIIFGDYLIAYSYIRTSSCMPFTINNFLFSIIPYSIWRKKDFTL